MRHTVQHAHERRSVQACARAHTHGTQTTHPNAHAHTPNQTHARSQFDIDFHALPCEWISLDVMDISGEMFLDVARVLVALCGRRSHGVGSAWRGV